MEVVAPAAATMGAQTPRDRRGYFAARRIRLHREALKAVADFNERNVECFRCFSTKQWALELDHVGYWKDSVRNSHGAERSLEALQHPERFMIMCRRCHQKYDLSNRADPRRKKVEGRLEGVVMVIPLVLTIYGSLSE